MFACIPAIAGSQVVVPPASEVPIPPKPKTDSTADSIAVQRDTIQAPFGRAVGARTADIGPQYQWNREEIFASGAYTVADLLERVPGTTGIRSGWLMSPKFVAHNGDLSKIKVIYDGVEIDNIDKRSNLLDLTTIELWTLESVSVERLANELRVSLRSWRVDRTNPYTRTDIYTGDEDTNIYRGFYGKRFFNGAGLQLSGQQHNTRSRLGGAGDALSFMGRFGIARRMWSADAFFLRRNAARTTQGTFGQGLAIQPYQVTGTLAYLRFGLGNASGGPWAQAIASYMRAAEESPHITSSAALSSRLLPDTTDTTTHRAQYSLQAGYSRGAIRASIGDRIRAYEGEIRQAPSARLEISHTLGQVGVFTERDVTGARTRGDILARFTPLPYLAFAGAASVDAPDNVAESSSGGGADERSTFVPKTTAFRAEAGVRILGPWLSAGIISRDTSVFIPPNVFDTAYSYRHLGRRQGLFVALRGRLYKDINVDVVGTQWDSAGYYQPRYQSRAEANLDTRWRSRFPSGNFGLKVAFIHEYRDRVTFPTSASNRVTPYSNVYSALVEIRILRGVATYQVRNMLSAPYQIVPDFFMHRAISIYGLRWEFWN